MPVRCEVVVMFGRSSNEGRCEMRLSATAPATTERLTLCQRGLQWKASAAANRAMSLSKRKLKILKSATECRMCIS